MEEMVECLSSIIDLILYLCQRWEHFLIAHAV